MPKKLRFFLDSEFNEHARRFTIEPISIALVPEDSARENFYAISNEFDETKITPWLAENVIRHLPAKEEWKSADQIRTDMTAYLASFKSADVSEVDIWAYNGSTDNVVMASFFGSLGGLRQAFADVGLPTPRFRDLKDISIAANDKLPPPANAHDCLADAIWTREMFNHLKPKLGEAQKLLGL